MEFSGSSWAEPSRARALQFLSWNRADNTDNTDNMYVKKSQIFTTTFKNYNQISKFSTSIMIITNSNQLYELV